MGNLHRGFIFDKVEIVEYLSMTHSTKGRQGAVEEPSIVFVVGGVVEWFRGIM
jgi:hypothetical protein